MVLIRCVLFSPQEIIRRLGDVFLVMWLYSNEFYNLVCPRQLTRAETDSGICLLETPCHFLECRALRCIIGTLNIVFKATIFCFVLPVFVVWVTMNILKTLCPH